MPFVADRTSKPGSSSPPGRRSPDDEWYRCKIPFLVSMPKSDEAWSVPGLCVGERFLRSRSETRSRAGPPQRGPKRRVETKKLATLASVVVRRGRPSQTKNLFKSTTQNPHDRRVSPFPAPEPADLAARRSPEPYPFPMPSAKREEQDTSPRLEVRCSARRRRENKNKSKPKLKKPMLAC